MSNIIPPLVSSSPPPMVAGELEDLDEDEFGDFTAAEDLSFDGYSLPSTPQHVPYSNYEVSTQSSLPVNSTSTNFSSKHKSIDLKESLSPEISCNGQAIDHLADKPVEHSKSRTVSNSENFKNIFCDIKSDVNIDNVEKYSVNNLETVPVTKEDINFTISNSIQNITPTVSSENALKLNDQAIVPTLNHEENKLKITENKLKITENKILNSENTENTLEKSDNTESTSHIQSIDSTNLHDYNNSASKTNAINNHTGDLSNITNKLSDNETEKENMVESLDVANKSNNSSDFNSISASEKKAASTEKLKSADFKGITDLSKSTDSEKVEIDTFDDFGDFESNNESPSKTNLTFAKSTSNVEISEFDSYKNNCEKTLDVKDITKISRESVADIDDDDNDNDDDYFGDFESNFTIGGPELDLKSNSIDTSNSEVSKQSDNLDFPSAILKQTEQESKSDEIDEQFSDTNEDFEDFGKFEYNSATTSKTIETNISVDNNNETKDMTPKKEDNSSKIDECGDFSNSIVDSTATKDENIIPDDSDSEFTSAFVTQTDNFVRKDSEEIQREISKNIEESKLDEEEFGDFNYNPTKINIEKSNSEESSSELEKPNLDDDFADFESNPTVDDKNGETDTETKDVNQEISSVENCNTDFANFTVGKTATETKTKTVPTLEDDFDDFGDFNDYSKQEENFELTQITYDTSKVPENTEKIIKDIFSHNVINQTDFEMIDFMNNDVFKQVQDIETTNALGYNWANSECQKMLLKALNIDSRNILYGPRWNASMPRFAANLGFTPLEPVKSELATVLQPLSPAVVPQPEPALCDVPAAKFDWTSSGLVNPLDLQPNDPVKQETIEEKLSKKLSQHSESTKQLSSDVIANLQSDVTALSSFGSLPHSDNESVNSLKFIETPVDIEIELKFENDNQLTDKLSAENVPSIPDDDDFTNFQSSKPEVGDTLAQNLTSFKMELRETHITAQNEDIPEIKPVINLDHLELKSTIVTPELPRRKEDIQEDDDEFADFQMVLPQAQKPVDFVASVPLEPLKPIVLETSATVASTQINWPEPGIVDDIEEFEFSFNPTVVKETQEVGVEEKKISKKEKEVQEDDWSDFVCAQEPSSKHSKPAKSDALKITSLPTMPNAKIQPTKPQKSYHNTNNLNLFKNIPNSSSQLELSVPNLQNTQMKRPVSTGAYIPHMSPTKTLTSQPSTQQIAAQQVGFGYQPPYQIPVETINTPFGGLPQTSLSAYNHFTVGPTELTNKMTIRDDKTSRSNEFSPFRGQFSEVKPVNSLNSAESQFSISTEYQLQSVESTFMQMKHPTVSNATKLDDDDDWTDFVSSQPLQSNVPNGWNSQQKSSGNTNSVAMSSWSHDLTPNIIANPVHFEVFQSYQAGSSQDNKNLSKKSGNSHHTQLKNKSSVPSISALPDLDFIAPKNIFFSKK